MRTAIVTEANQSVATGHLMEAIELQKLLMDKGDESFVFVNDTCPELLIQRISGNYIKYKRRADALNRSLIKAIAEKQFDIVITDLRSVDNEFIQSIKKCQNNIRIVCIDEWGNRRLEADAIINPMVEAGYWRYDAFSLMLYAGANYLILPQNIHNFRKELHGEGKEIRQIVIAMGGVDEKGSTCKLMSWLPLAFPEVRYDIILGGGFLQDEKLNKILENLEKEKAEYQICKNILDIYSHFLDADLAFCAGGNTLHELSCIGVPTIVIPTMPHEYQNGKAFEEIGSALCLPLSDHVSEKEVIDAVRNVKDYRIRRRMSEAGKRKIDGKGIYRTYNVLQHICSYDEF